jgi:hypothetical protein
MQGLDEAVGIESLAPGDIIGIEPPFVVKEGHSPGSIDRGLIRVCCPLLKPLLSHFFGLRCVEFMADSSKIMVSPKMAHKCLWTSLMKALEHLVMLQGQQVLTPCRPAFLPGPALCAGNS